MKSILCENILYLLPLYVEGKTSFEQNIEIENHLKVCPECFVKYRTLKSVAERIKAAFADFKQFENERSEQDFFKNNLCAYVDNELEKSEYYAFNRFTSDYPEAQRELENMLLFEENLQNSIRVNSRKLNDDFSSVVIKKLMSEDENFVSDIFAKAIGFVGILVLLLALAGWFSLGENTALITDLQNQIFTKLTEK